MKTGVGGEGGMSVLDAPWSQKKGTRKSVYFRGLLGEVKFFVPFVEKNFWGQTEGDRKVCFGCLNP